MERIKTALENLDLAIDGLEAAYERHGKQLEKIVEGRAAKRVKAAAETAERALKQAQSREAQASAREGKQRELTGMVATRLDDAIVRLEQIIRN